MSMDQFGQSVRLSRRRALQLMGIGPAAILLSACTTALPPASATLPPATAAAKPAAAQPQPTVAGASGTTPSAGAPKTGGILRALQAGDLASMDGHYYTTGNGLSIWIIYETLTVYDDNL
jgi:hypothetical protein